MVGITVIKKNQCTCDKKWCARAAAATDTRECDYCFRLAEGFKCPKGGPSSKKTK